MKRLSIFILVLVCVLGITGCSKESNADNVDAVFQATILEIRDDGYLVKPSVGSKELNSTDLIYVSLKNVAASPEPEVGDIIEITYDGEIMESDPARIQGVYSLRVIAESIAASSEQVDLIPMVMVDGVLYFDTGHESTVEGRCGVLDGEITSEVAGNERPTEGQSNFGTGYGYQYGSQKGTIDIYINGKWWVYAAEEVK